MQQLLFVIELFFALLLKTTVFIKYALCCICQLLATCEFKLTLSDNQINCERSFNELKIVLDLY